MKSRKYNTKGNPTHGMSRTPTHNTWLAMKQRCYYGKHAQFAYYGGRGIVVCDRWVNDFAAFFNDMGEKPTGMSIERIDTSGNYTPENCKWATNIEQSRNRRCNINIKFGGRVQCVAAWCFELGIHPDKVYGEIRRGATPEEALSCAR